MKSSRTLIPEKIVDEVLNNCGFACCVCHKDKNIQIHHINEDPSDHDLDNLAPLCHDCHDKAHTRGWGRATIDLCPY